MTVAKSDLPAAPLRGAAPSLPARTAIRLINLVIAALDIYALSALFYLGARLLVGEAWQPVNFANNLMPSLLIPAVILWVVVGLLRRWRTFLLLSPSLVAFVGLYGAMLLPKAVQIPPDAPTLTIMTWNLHRSIEPDEAQAALEIIRDVNADIVALQEFTQPAADFLTPRIADLYPYNALYPYARGVNGMGIYSRFPIYAESFWTGLLGNMRVQMSFADTLFTFYNLHPPSPGLTVDTRFRTAEITDLLDRLAGETTPLIVVGDFNLTDQSNDYARLTEVLTDSFREAGEGLGLTFPNLAYANPLLGAAPPIIRIDYIFHDANWQALEARVYESSGLSDHYPVIARLAFVGAE
jgi:endonuclease/exonuclease/phosphatase (EEP) superfamily protein YafD